MTRCFIGLGANLGDAPGALRGAARALRQLPGSQLVDKSPIYRSAPVGPPGQPDYLNAVIALDTDLNPEVLLDHLQAMENAAGRERSVRWGPRTLDLDLLIFGEQRISSPRLQVPHPRLAQRNFVLQPLIDLLGKGWRFADGPSLGELLANCPANRLTATRDAWADKTDSGMDRCA